MALSGVEDSPEQSDGVLCCAQNDSIREAQERLPKLCPRPQPETPPLPERSKLLTEQRNPRTTQIDLCSSLDIVDAINVEDRGVAEAVGKVREPMAEAVDLIVDAFRTGGRLFYVGAGTSGRLGVLDASECPPTFGVEPELVQGIIAGGLPALVKSAENKEDMEDDGGKALDERGVTAKDVVVGIAASGTTPYVRGALRRAKEMGCVTVFFTCNPSVPAPCEVDVEIRPIVGPEAVTGSTRMKAGTATKLVLNTLTTAAMIRMGRVYENLMVDLRATNEKLKDRARRITMTVAPMGEEEARALLDAAGGRVKTAIVMHALGVGCEEAERRLEECGGFVRRAIGQG